MRTHFLILLSIIICGNLSGQRVTQIDSVAFYKQRPKVYYDANAEYQLSASMGDDHAYQDTIIIPTRDSLYKFISYTEDYNELFGLYREIPKYRNYRSIVYLSYNWLDTYYVNLTNNRVFFFYGLTCRYGNKLLSVNRNSSDRRAYIGIYKINGDSIKELWSISPQNLDIYNIKEVYLRTKYVYICYEGLEAKYYVKIDTTFPLLSSGNIRETYKIPNAGTKECVQRMQYYPSGLPWAEATNASEQPWKYNGKEFVEMHGLDEYDSKARWYYPAVCRTTTMDPLAERYYSTSPYAWCGNNPVRFVDPDGMKIVIRDSVSDTEIEYESGEEYIGDNDYIVKVYSDLDELKQDHPEVAAMIEELVDSEKTHYIESTLGYNYHKATYSQSKDNHTLKKTSIKYSPYRYTTANDDFRTPRVGLAHELKHALDTDNDSLDQTLIQGVPFSEIVAIRVENLIRKVLNEPMRTTYKGKKIDEKYLK